MAERAGYASEPDRDDFAGAARMGARPRLHGDVAHAVIGPLGR